MSNEQEMHNTLITVVNTHASALVESMNKMPLHPTYRAYFNLNFDQAMYWAKTAIENIKMTPPTPAANDQVPATEPAAPAEPIAA